MRRHHGFTLIEVMIVVGIIGILSAIAIPSYSQYVMRARITEGVGALSAMRLKMEQHFQDNRSYATACTNGTISQLPTGIPYFTLGCSGLSGSAYTVTATGSGPMLGFVYTIDQTNARATTGVPSGWTSNATCWVLKKDGSC